MANSNTTAVYGDWAKTYDSSPNATRDADRAVMRVLAPRFANLDVLEFGCGTGKNTRAFATEAHTVLGVDISEAMLAVAQSLALPSSVAFTRIEPGARWPAKDASIDVVTASLVLEHIEDLSTVFAEAARVLKPGGWFWTSELHPVRQWRGSKARFDSADGSSRSPDCYLHGFADFVNAAHAARFQVCEVQEPSEAKPPRLLVIGFRLQTGDDGAHITS